MTDYTKLVAALRCELQGVPCHDENCEWLWHGGGCCDEVRMMVDAADAIEALQAENPIVESVLLDKMRQQMEETVCHCNVKENAELIAKILDDDVDGKVFELPKRGEWIEMQHGDEVVPSLCKCSVCGSTWLGVGGYNYCPSCGAKMTEVQE